MRVKVIRTINAPDGSTHYCGDLMEDPTFYKMTMVGVVGEHWWYFDPERNGWYLSGHSKPHWIKELQEVNE